MLLLLWSTKWDMEMAKREKDILPEMSMPFIWVKYRLLKPIVQDNYRSLMKGISRKWKISKLKWVKYRLMKRVKKNNMSKSRMKLKSCSTWENWIRSWKRKKRKGTNIERGKSRRRKIRKNNMRTTTRPRSRRLSRRRPVHFRSNSLNKEVHKKFWNRWIVKSQLRYSSLEGN